MRKRRELWPALCLLSTFMPLPSDKQAGTAGTSGVSPRGGTFFFHGGTDDLWAGGRGGIQKVPIFLGFEKNE